MMMKKKDYRKEIGERIEEAYLSMPIGDPPSREKFDKWIAIAEQRRRERIRRRKRLVSCAAVMLLCVCLGVACIIKPPQVAAGGKGGSKVGQTLETTDVYKSQADLPEEVKEEFLLFSEMPEGYSTVEVRLENNLNAKAVVLLMKNNDAEEISIRQLKSNTDDFVSFLDEDSVVKEWAGIDVHIKAYEDGDEEVIYKFIYENIFVSINTPKGLGEEQVKTLIEKAALA